MRFTDELRIRIKGDSCIYCGEYATSTEHYPPATFGYHGFLFPCCLECNSFAGASYGYSFSRRCRWVKDKLQNKYKSVLSMPHWDEEELSELGYSLRVEIESCVRAKQIVQERLAWSALTYLSTLDKEKDFAAILAECDTITNNAPQNWKSSVLKQEAMEDDAILFKNKYD